MTRIELWRRRYDLGTALTLTRHARSRAIERGISLASIRIALAQGDWVSQLGKIRVSIHPSTPRPLQISSETWRAARTICVVVCHSGHIPTVWRRSEP